MDFWFETASLYTISSRSKEHLRVKKVQLLREEEDLQIGASSSSS
jgi:hypothetical protein